MKWFVWIFSMMMLTAGAQNPYVLVLGNTQDGGLPHAGCVKSCCRNAWDSPDLHRPVSCIAFIDPVSHQSWMFDATPDFAEQLQALRKHLGDSAHLPSAIFITHAHIGHYTGLMQLGKEVMSSKQLPVYVMPRMMHFLKTNGPWSQLVSMGNIVLRPLQENQWVAGNDRVQIMPYRVPHRDEFSETVGFSIRSGESSCLFVPDIDKWSKWFPEQTAQKLDSIFSNHQFILVDGTFYNQMELGNRSMTEIPHPTIEESISLFNRFTYTNKRQILFIHLNHTNPLLHDENLRKQIVEKGYSVAEPGMILR